MSRGAKIDILHNQSVLHASVPLDETDWEPLARGSVLALHDGAALFQNQN